MTTGRRIVTVKKREGKPVTHSDSDSLLPQGKNEKTNGPTRPASRSTDQTDTAPAALGPNWTPKEPFVQSSSERSRGRIARTQGRTRWRRKNLVHTTAAPFRPCRFPPRPPAAGGQRKELPEVT
ncbi:hypothetical protein ZHAS_00003341 [Anopheles sinensis]|uniref:Uncharacterized protein n=1 Tax=Anopheles sinensis TaxID=74873 RepID=A0A084VE36_ANOSI|nr:hypothetical protein ZHAS_00003341 [Anopheles sinensis]